MRITPNELDLVLAALFELHITRAEEQQTRATIRDLVRKIGGDPEAEFFGAYDKNRHKTSAPAEHPASDAES